MMWSVDEVAKHNNQDSCWVIINGKVYDVTAFLPEHPGGPEIILRWAGKDATEEYESTHPPGTIEQELPPEKHLGEVKVSSSSKNPPTTEENLENSKAALRPIDQCVSLLDLESAARTVATKRAWIYYSSAAEDCHSHKLNVSDWRAVLFRPRVLRNVVRVDMSCNILGNPSRLPIFIAPAALARLGHPDGELCLVKGAGDHRIGYMVSSASSVAIETLAEAARHNGTCLFYQLYVRKKRTESIALIRKAKELGFKALVITVDTPVVGKREEDDRFRIETGLAAPATSSSTSTSAATTTLPDENIPVLRGPYSSTLNWDDLEWIRKEWGNAGPICLKGIATAEDAKLAAEAGIKSLYLSNHGGRQLDGAPSSLRTLLEIRKYYPEVLEQCEVLLDGGVRRGSDILKALCLGARGVGIGRPFMYALSAYGAQGVSKAIQILSDEIETTMRLLGVTSISHLDPQLVNARDLELRISNGLLGFKASI